MNSEIIINEILHECFDKWQITNNRDYFENYLYDMINYNMEILDTLSKMLLLKKDILLIPKGIQLTLKELYPAETNKFLEAEKVRKYLLK